MGIPPVFPSERQVTRRQALAGKLVISCLIGIATGLGIAAQMTADAEEGRSLTLQEYIADFEEHKAELESFEMPPAASVASGVIFALVVFGIYEVLGLGLGRVFAALGRWRHRDRLSTVSEH
jgi:hypothetical protein